MSAFPSSRALGGLSIVLLLAASAAEATIVLDGRLPSSGVRAGAVHYPAYSATGYAVARSHAWMKYERGSGAGASGLVAAPYAGAWHASTPREISVRSNIARAQSYRIGGRW